MGKPPAQTGFADKTLVRSGRFVADVLKYVNEDTAAPNAGTRYCQVFDAASTAAVTLGTTIPLRVLVAPSKGSDEQFWLSGLVLSNGMVVASTTTATGNTLATTGTAHVFVGVN